MNIKEAIDEYMVERLVNERYSSFDYCYNYFYEFYKQDEIEKISDEKNLQTSCMQLGFYLASWGMFRGSSFLIKKSANHFKTLIEKISQMEPELWEIDVNTYDDENIKLLCSKKNGNN